MHLPGWAPRSPVSKQRAGALLSCRYGPVFALQPLGLAELKSQPVNFAPLAALRVLVEPRGVTTNDKLTQFNAKV